MCGISAVYLGSVDASSRAVVPLVEAAMLLQHRGQDACGIATASEDGNLYRHRGNGLASEVFQNPRHIADLLGHMGIVHLRYATAGTLSLEDAQPLYDKLDSRVFLVHNGNLVNSTDIREYLQDNNTPFSQNGSDTELMLAVLSYKLRELEQDDFNLSNDNAMLEAIKEVYLVCKGSFACVAMMNNSLLVGFRDANGIKPLAYGQRRNSDGSIDYMFSSESIALESLGFCNIQDVRPGEAVVIHSGSKQSDVPRLSRHQVSPMLSYTPDVFEYVYLAQPGSVIDGISVHRSRQRMGFALAESIRQQLSKEVYNEIDVVIPIPETSYIGALATAQRLGKSYSHGILRNVYSARTFIMPDQKERMKAVRKKLCPLKEEFEDRVVLLIDDSIVRGTTSREIIRMAREAGAKKVIFASCSPPVKYNHVYGVNLADVEELVAHSRSNPQICEELGCDELIYLPLDKLISACRDAAKVPVVNTFEEGIFTGRYVTGGQEKYLENAKHFMQMKKKAKRRIEKPTFTNSLVECFPSSKGVVSENRWGNMDI